MIASPTLDGHVRSHPAGMGPTRADCGEFPFRCFGHRSLEGVGSPAFHRAVPQVAAGMVTVDVDCCERSLRRLAAVVVPTPTLDTAVNPCPTGCMSDADRCEHASGSRSSTPPVPTPYCATGQQPAYTGPSHSNGGIAIACGDAFPGGGYLQLNCETPVLATLDGYFVIDGLLCPLTHCGDATSPRVPHVQHHRIVRAGAGRQIDVLASGKPPT